MADFEKEKINKGKITDFWREEWEMTFTSSRFNRNGKRRKIIGKLDLLFFYLLTEIEKLFRFLDFRWKIKID